MDCNGSYSILIYLKVILRTLGLCLLQSKVIHSWKLTWKPKKGPIKTTVLLKGDYMGFHVSLGECIQGDFRSVRVAWGCYASMRTRLGTLGGSPNRDP